MAFKAVLYAYVIGGFTFVPLLICAAVAWTIYTSVPVGDPDPAKLERKKLAEESRKDEEEVSSLTLDDQARSRKGWLTVRRTFEPKESDGSYVAMMRQFLDARSKDPKRSRPKDMWYVILKGNVLYLYEDESMTECEAAIQVSSYEVVVYPEGLLDGELFTKRNAVMLKSKGSETHKRLPSLTKEMVFEPEAVAAEIKELDTKDKNKQKEKEKLEEMQRVKSVAKEEAFDTTTPWFIFVRTCVEMEDWYHALIHASSYSSQSTLAPVRPVFSPADMNRLVSTLDEQPDVIPVRWLNALLGRLFYSFYRTQHLENFIIGRLMKKLSKVKAPTFLQDISVTNVSVGNAPPTFSKPMLKELTKEGDAALEIRLTFKGEVRITAQATAIINLGQRFKTYTVKLVLAVVLRKLDGNLLVKVKRPPSDRIWYAFTQPPDIELDVEPIVSDRQIKWGMICSTIESRLKEILNESVVLPNMDDIAFFDSEDYLHRGGIWGDACRKVQLGSEFNGSAKTMNSADDLNIESIAKSHSASDAVDLVNDNVGRESVIQSVVKSTSEVPNSPEKNSISSDALLTGPISVETTTSDTLHPEDDRGRSPTIETGGRRATSVPAAKSSSVEALGVSEPTVSQQDARQDIGDSASSSETDAPISGHSRIRSLSSGANAASSAHGSSRESLASRATNSTNASTFLSALKAKDKQALSNTAKEAMRKWSANWSGFKRDRTGDSNNPDEIADGVSQGSMSTLFGKGRNFSDLRAAVSARRDTRNTVASDERSPESSSTPIDIPARKDRDEDSIEAGSSTSPYPGKEIDDSSNSPTPQSSSPRGPSILRQDSSRASPSPPKVTAETHLVPTLSTTASKAGETEEEPPKVTAPPIKTQPSQGAMMTIPGIHASHRGEVMSYGYVPPSPSTSTSSASKRASTIQPTIQSMYRLFKSPTAGSAPAPGQQEQSDSAPNSPALSRVSTVERSPSQPGSLTLEPDDANAKSETTLQRPVSPQAGPPAAENSAEPTPQHQIKRKPPPLPPRGTLASSRPQTQPETSPDASLNFSGPTIQAAELNSPGSSLAPSASESLKLIAEQDETKRKDLEASSSSPERRPRAGGGKRNSLGARRITGAVISDEPESLQSPIAHESDRVTEVVTKPANGVVQEQASPAETERTNQSSDSKLSTSEAKPTPPPLPPRRNSTLASTS